MIGTTRLIGFILIPITLALSSGCRKQEDPATPSADAGVASSLVASEELILDLTPRLREFGPGLFSVDCQFTGLPAAAATEKSYPQISVTETMWELPAESGQGTPVKPTIAKMIAPVGDVELRYSRFSIVSGQFTDDGRTAFRTKVSFSGSAEGLALSSTHAVDWKQLQGGEWKVSSWVTRKLSVQRSTGALFEEVLDNSISDPASLAQARTSLHQKILVDSYFGGKPAKLPPNYSDSRFYPDSINMHPAVSVVDIDRDGHDDLYLCVRWGKNQLLRNLGNGTFEECSARFGLDINGRNAVALFADFDNDGDADLLLGRSLERSMFLINDKGFFRAHERPVSNGQLPWLVTSASAADYNNDGLLDVFLCTYSPLDINARLKGTGSAPEWARRFLPAEQAQEVVRREASDHKYLNQVGPPNVLLVNRGGHFEIAPASGVIAGYYNSFQAAWSDFDSDGDQDLYVANDYAPDHFFRNDGNGAFSDITSTAGIDTLGFAMGASWGDYDGDGDDDLYVSNMFSKAGRRITAQIHGLDRRMSAVAYGNFLYRNGGDGAFERMSGADDKPIQVHLAGWSWGGQFTDFDNDGHLDLYVSSGFYTPPPAEDNGVDL